MKSTKSIEFGKLSLEAVFEDNKPPVLSISFKEGKDRKKTAKITYNEAKKAVEWLQSEVFKNVGSEDLLNRKVPQTGVSVRNKAPSGLTSTQQREARQKLEGITDLGAKGKVKGVKF